jgi:DNA polymerase III, alpha subunit
MSGVPSALLAQEKCDEAAAAAIEFQEILGKGNYFLEIQEHGLDAQRRIRKSWLNSQPERECHSSRQTMLTT